MGVSKLGHHVVSRWSVQSYHEVICDSSGTPAAGILIIDASLVPPPLAVSQTSCLVGKNEKKPTRLQELTGEGGRVFVALSAPATTTKSCRRRLPQPTVRRTCKPTVTNEQGWGP